MTSDVRLVYVTTQSPAQAESLANSLMDDGLIACANILPGMTSIYRWEGKRQSEIETVLILKTMQSQIARVLSLIKERHTYENPCALVLRVDEGLAAYLEWLAANISKE